MEWYWYLIIAIGVVLVLVLIGLFGGKKIKSLAYTLVLAVEKLYGQGCGAEKFSLVIKKLSELTKGIIPEAVLVKIVEWAVKRMKDLLQENAESMKKTIKLEENSKEE